MNESLGTVEGQFKAGRTVAKNYWNFKIENRMNRLELRALLHRMFLPDMKTRQTAENKKLLLDAWERGIMEGRRLRLGG